MSQPTYTKIIPICPNCGGQHIKEKFVKESLKVNSQLTLLTEYIKEKTPPSQNCFVFEGTLDGFLKYIQFVAQCEDCSYTIVKNFPESK